MIEKLTPEQEALMPIIVEEYRKIGLATGPIDRVAAVDYAKRLYAALGRAAPKQILFEDGPFAAWKTVCYWANGEKHPDQLPELVWPYLDGQFTAGYAAWLSFWKKIGLTLRDTSLIEDSIHFGPIFTLDEVCVFCERPLKISMVDGRLHCDGGPSVEYGDGTKCFTLNGVAVPEWLACTPAGDLDFGEFAKIQNTEVRREFIRKLETISGSGVLRLMKGLGAKVLDSQGDYELVTLDLMGQTGVQPYLKMKNPSIDVYHLECVGADCKTVDDALTFRNGTSLRPQVLT